MNHTRLTDTGDIRLSGKASSISAQLKAIAARATGRVPFTNQEEATPTVLSSPTGGGLVQSVANQFQDVDASADFYMPGISRSAI